MKKKYFYIILIVFTIGKNALSQEIANVLARRIPNGGVEIKYDLTSLNKNDSIFFIELFLFQDDKLLFKITDAAGDIGFIVKPGIAKKINWNPFNVKTDLLIENARFKITAIPKNKEGMVLIVGGSKKDTLNSLVYEIKSFYADRKEVCYSDFKKFVAEINYETDAEASGNAYAIINGSFEKNENYNWKYNSNLKKINMELVENNPIIFISYNDASKYCEWKKKRLPTDIEWEVMATNCFEYPILNLPTENAWFRENSFNSYHEVSSLNSNKLGFYHLFGNVSEWCNIDLSSHLNTQTQNLNTGGVRGGSFITSQNDMNINYRTTSTKNNSYQDVGFRCVSSVIE